MNNTMNSTMQKIPGIGDIPILGLLFKSKAAQKNQTELVVMITPEILPNNSPGVTPNLPKLAEPYLPPMTLKKDVPTPAPAFRAADSQPAAPVAVAKPSSPADRTTSSADNTPSPAAAAATLKGSSPATRTVVRSPDPAPARPAAAPVTTAAAPSAPAAASTSRPATARERQAAERAQREDRRQQEIAATRDGRREKTPREAG